MFTYFTYSKEDFFHSLSGSLIIFATGTMGTCIDLVWRSGETCTATPLLRNPPTISSPVHLYLFRGKSQNNTVHPVKQSSLSKNLKHILVTRQMQNSSRKINHFNYVQDVQVTVNNAIPEHFFLFDYMENICSVFLVYFNDSAGVQSMPAPHLLCLLLKHFPVFSS